MENFEKNTSTEIQNQTENKEGKQLLKQADSPEWKEALKQAEISLEKTTKQAQEKLAENGNNSRNKIEKILDKYARIDNDGAITLTKNHTNEETGANTTLSATGKNKLDSLHFSRKTDNEGIATDTSTDINRLENWVHLSSTREKHDTNQDTNSKTNLSINHNPDKTSLIIDHKKIDAQQAIHEYSANVDSEGNTIVSTKKTEENYDGNKTTTEKKITYTDTEKSGEYSTDTKNYDGSTENKHIKIGKNNQGNILEVGSKKTDKNKNVRNYSVRKNGENYTGNLKRVTNTNNEITGDQTKKTVTANANINTSDKQTGTINLWKQTETINLINGVEKNNTKNITIQDTGLEKRVDFSAQNTQKIENNTYQKNIDTGISQNDFWVSGYIWGKQTESLANGTSKSKEGKISVNQTENGSDIKVNFWKSSTNAEKVTRTRDFAIWKWPNSNLVEAKISKQDAKDNTGYNLSLKNEHTKTKNTSTIEGQKTFKTETKDGEKTETYSANVTNTTGENKNLSAKIWREAKTVDWKNILESKQTADIKKNDAETKVTLENTNSQTNGKDSQSITQKATYSKTDENDTFGYSEEHLANKNGNISKENIGVNQSTDGDKWLTYSTSSQKSDGTGKSASFNLNENKDDKLNIWANFSKTTANGIGKDKVYTTNKIWTNFNEQAWYEDFSVDAGHRTETAQWNVSDHQWTLQLKDGKIGDANYTYTKEDPTKQWINSKSFSIGTQKKWDERSYNIWYTSTQMDDKNTVSKAVWAGFTDSDNYHLKWKYSNKKQPNKNRRSLEHSIEWEIWKKEGLTYANGEYHRTGETSKLKIWADYQEQQNSPSKYRTYASYEKQDKTLNYWLKWEYSNIDLYSAEWYMNKQIWENTYIWMQWDISENDRNLQAFIQKKNIKGSDISLQFSANTGTDGKKYMWWVGYKKLLFQAGTVEGEPTVQLWLNLNKAFGFSKK